MLFRFKVLYKVTLQQSFFFLKECQSVFNGQGSRMACLTEVLADEVEKTSRESNTPNIFHETTNLSLIEGPRPSVYIMNMADKLFALNGLVKSIF